MDYSNIQYSTETWCNLWIELNWIELNWIELLYSTVPLLDWIELILLDGEESPADVCLLYGVLTVTVYEYCRKYCTVFILYKYVQPYWVQVWYCTSYLCKINASTWTSIGRHCTEKCIHRHRNYWMLNNLQDCIISYSTDMHMEYHTCKYGTVHRVMHLL